MGKAKKCFMLCVSLCLLLSVSVFPAYAAKEEELTEGQKNIVRRARQLVEVEWTPLYDRAQWGYAGVFEAGTTYTGVPYGQAVHAKYIGYDASISEFVAATEDSNSDFYTQYSQYRKIAPYYSTDCSGFVSYAWGLKLRRTSSSLPEVAEKIPEQSLEALEVGDCLDDLYSHALLVTDVVRDRRGRVIAVEIMEQTPVIARRKLFGEGGEDTLEYFKNYYFSRGYYIYRLMERESVEYVHDCAVPLDGDFCSACAGNAPMAEISAQGAVKVVTLSHNGGGEIYFTTDGSEPNKRSERYSSPLIIEHTTSLKAVVIHRGESSRVLNYHIAVEQAQAPQLSQLSGREVEGELSYGSTVALSSTAAGAGIYYTTDGSDPQSHGKLYTNPILLTDDMDIRAMTYAPGYLPSEQSSYALKVKKAAQFSDVTQEAWYANAVNYVQSMGYFQGTGKETFSPDDTMTRGMFVTVLGRMAGISAIDGAYIGLVTGDDVNVRSGPGTAHSIIGSVNRGDMLEVLEEHDGWYAVVAGEEFGYISADYLNAYEGQLADLDESKYYSSYVQWAYLSGISRGMGDGMFGAEEATTRQDMAVLLYNFARIVGNELSVLQEPMSFTDEARIKEEAVEAVRALQLAGIVKGMGDGSYAPLEDVNRAQVAQIIMNYYLADIM